jgi:uncharacterized protein YbjT (DUF2867 family)
LEPAAVQDTPRSAPLQNAPGQQAKRKALIAGATGLVGGQLLNLLLNDEGYEAVYVLTRRPLPAHPKLHVLEADFNQLDTTAWPAVHDVFCCLGTTIRASGSRAAFRTVDYQYPVTLAAGMRRTGAKRFLLVSALGADANSAIFYNRVKGETEQQIAQAGFASLHIFRPSLLLGQRSEKRPGEDAAKWVNRRLGFLIPKKYKGIEAAKVARAMLYWAKQDTNGIQVHESETLQAF